MKLAEAQYPPPEPRPSPKTLVAEESEQYGHWFLAEYPPDKVPYRQLEREPKRYREFSMAACELEARSPYSTNMFVPYEPSEWTLEKEQKLGRVRDPADWGMCTISPVAEVVMTYAPRRDERLDVFVREAGKTTGWIIRNVSSVRSGYPSDARVTYYNREMLDREAEYSEKVYDGTQKRGFLFWSPGEKDVPAMQATFEYPYEYGPWSPYSPRAIVGAQVQVSRDEENDSYVLRVEMPAHARLIVERERAKWERI